MSSNRVLPPPEDAWGVAVDTGKGPKMWCEVYRSREEAAMHVNHAMPFAAKPCRMTVVPVSIRPLKRVLPLGANWSDGKGGG